MSSVGGNSSLNPVPQTTALVVAPQQGVTARLFGPKLAATLVLTGIVVAAVAMAVLTLRLPSNQNSFAAQRTPVPVRIVSAPQPSTIPCAQQTWPYIEAHCLKQGGDKIMPVPIASTPRESAGENAAKAQQAKAQQDDGAAKRELTNVASAPADSARARDEFDAAAPIVGPVPLPQPRPVAADESDEEFAAPEPPRHTRSRRYYYDDPPRRLVRELNRVIPFGILRF